MGLQASAWSALCTMRHWDVYIVRNRTAGEFSSLEQGWRGGNEGWESNTDRNNLENGMKEGEAMDGCNVSYENLKRLRGQWCIVEFNEVYSKRQWWRVGLNQWGRKNLTSLKGDKVGIKEGRGKFWSIDQSGIEMHRIIGEVDSGKELRTASGRLKASQRKFRRDTRLVHE